MSENFQDPALADDGSVADQNIPGQAASGDSGQLTSEETLIDRGVDDLLDEGYSPPERPSIMTREGFTAEDEREGQSLDERLAAEVPDVGEAPSSPDSLEQADDYDPESVGDERAGRLTDGGGLADAQADDILATDVGIDGGAASAEEAAVHVIDDEANSEIGDDA